MDETIDLSISKKLYRVIAKNPGVHLSDIAEHMQMNITRIEQYVSSLEQQGSIRAEHEENSICYYIQKQRRREDRRTRDTRKEIYNLLVKEPGIHLSKIATTLNMSITLAEYHTSQMEKNDLITALRDETGYYKRYYIKSKEIGIKDKQILAVLRKEPLLKIVLLLLQNPNIRHKDLSEKMNISPSTLSYHLESLIDYNLVTATSYGKERGYSLKDENETIRIIRTYRLGLMVEQFTDLWKDLNLS